MKKLIMRLVVVLIMGLVSLDAFAQGENLEQKVSFRGRMWVGNTNVEPGQYLAKYDANTGEISIIAHKMVIATAKATVKRNNRYSVGNAFLANTTPMGERLTGIRVRGSYDEIVITNIPIE